MHSLGNKVRTTIVAGERGSGAKKHLFLWMGVELYLCYEWELVNKCWFRFRSSRLICTFQFQLRRTEQGLGAGVSIDAMEQRKGDRKNGLSWKSSVHFSHSCRLPPHRYPIFLLLSVPRSPASSLPLLSRSGRAFNTCGWKGQLCERPVLSSHPQDASACPVQ